MACSACRKHNFPSKLRMAKSALKATGGAIKAYVGGQPVLSLTEMYHKRTMICKDCPSKKYVVEVGRCEQCGCFIRLKAALATEKCPLGHW